MDISCDWHHHCFAACDRIGLLVGRSEPLERDSYPSYISGGRPPAQIFPCAKASGREESELCAQWRSAQAAETSAYWSKWASLVGIVGTAAVLVALYMALEANRIARNTAARQLRAYVAVDHIVMSDPVIGYSPTATLKVTNFGQTPAHRFEVMSRSGWGPAGNEDFDISAYLEEPGPSAPSSLAPGASSLAYPGAGLTWTAVLDGQFKAGKLRLIVFGYVEYVDIFGIARRTEFKAFRDRDALPGMLIFFPTGNSST